MKKISGLILLLMFILSSICFAQSVKPAKFSGFDLIADSDKGRLGLVLVQEQILNSDTDITSAISKGINENFNNNREYKYVNSQETVLNLRDYMDKRNIDAFQINRQQIIDYAKEQNLDYIVFIKFYTGYVKFNYDPWNGITCNTTVQMDVKALDVANNTSLYIDTLSINESGATEIRACRDAIPKLMDLFSSKFKAIYFAPIIKEQD